MKSIIKFLVVFVVGLGAGFGLGIYTLPILIADAPADEAILLAEASSAERQAIFVKDRKGSDFGHWGKGTLYISNERATLEGELSPGPDYRLYLTPKFVETGDGFRAIKSESLEVASIKGFKNFSYELPPGVDVSKYNAVVVWCERFGQFITSGPLTTRG